MADEYPTLRRWTTFFVVVVGSIFVTAFGVTALYYAVVSGGLERAVEKNFIGLFGPVLSSVVSLLLVVLLRVTAGPIEFKLLGVEFKGASGPIVLWCFSFLLQVLAIRLLCAADCAS